MTNRQDVLAKLSASLAARAEAAARITIGIRLPSGAHLSGTLWRSDVVVTSEQSLPQLDEYDVAAADERTSTAAAVGRDRGTNVAALRLAQPLPFAATERAEPQTGAIALAFGADAAGAVTTRLAAVHSVGPKWHSRAGGTIERRIVLDARLGPAEEGGPVLDAAGLLIGMSTFGPSGQVLVIPTATIERVLPQLLAHGHVARGWLGLALQPVAVPDALQEAAGQSRAMMVMSLAKDGPGATAGIQPGDLLLSIAGQPASGFRKLAAALDADKVGTEVDVRVLRGAAIEQLNATIASRPQS
jgi:S1-C subfamily serine protease